MKILLRHAVDKVRKDNIKAEMVQLGAPRVRAIYHGDIWFAIEGSHRLAAAHELGLVPEIVDVTECDDIVIAQENTILSAGVLRDQIIRGNSGIVLEFKENEHG